MNVHFSNQSTKSHHSNHIYVGSQSAELREQLLNKEMEFKDKEIALLKRIIELMEAKTDVANQE